MAIKGTTKVIHKRDGSVSVQEELNGEIRVFTGEQWAKELERRREAAAKPGSGDVADLGSLSYQELKDLAKELGLKQSGKAEELRERIAEHLDANAEKVEITPNTNEGDHPLIQDDDEQDD